MKKCRITALAACVILAAAVSDARAEGDYVRAAPALVQQVDGPPVTLRAKEARDLPRVFCPQGQTSTGGGIRLNPNNGVFLTASNPGGPGWDISVDNQSDEPRTVTPLVICAADPSITHQVGTTANGPTAESAATCPAGQFVAGGGAVAKAKNYLSLSISDANHWFGRAKNVNTVFTGVVAFARCSNRPHSAANGDTVTLQPGTTGTSQAQCPDGQVPTAGGGSGNPNVLHNASAPTATGWSLRATNTDNVPRLVVAHVVCTAP